MLDGVAAPVVLMTWVMVPTPPSETVSRSCHATPAVLGEENALAELTAGSLIRAASRFIPIKEPLLLGIK